MQKRENTGITSGVLLARTNNEVEQFKVLTDNGMNKYGIESGQEAYCLLA